MKRAEKTTGSEVLPPAPNDLGLSRIEDVLTTDEQKVLHETLFDESQRRYRAAGALVTRLFGEDDGLPLPPPTTDNDISLGMAIAHSLAHLSSSRAEVTTNSVDIDGTNPDAIILTYGSGDSSFTLEA